MVKTVGLARPHTTCVYWDLAAEERHRAELQARSENANNKEVEEKLQQMTAKALVEAAEAHVSSGGGGDSGDCGSGGGGGDDGGCSNAGND